MSIIQHFDGIGEFMMPTKWKMGLNENQQHISFNAWLINDSVQTGLKDIDGEISQQQFQLSDHDNGLYFSFLRPDNTVIQKYLVDFAGLSQGYFELKDENQGITMIKLLTAY